MENHAGDHEEAENDYLHEQASDDELLADVVHF